MTAISRRVFAGGMLAALSPAPAAAQFLGIPGSVTTIGIVAPQTGNARPAGEQLINGARQALDDYNQFHSATSMQFGLHPYDDQNEIATAVVNAGFAIQDPSIIAVIGHLGGYETDATVSRYAEAGLALVVPVSTLDSITQHGYRNVFRLPTRDSSEGDIFAQYVLQTHKPTNVMVLVQDGDYGAPVARSFIGRIRGAKIPVQATTFPWEHPDFAAVAKAVMTQTPDYVFMAGTVTDMGTIVPALQAAGYTGTFGASQGFFDPMTLGTYAKATEGLVVSSSMPPLSLAPSAYQVQNTFHSRYGAFSPVAAFGYAAAQLIVAAATRTSATTRAALLTAMTTPIPTDTVVGSFTFTPSGDPNDPNLYFYTVKDGAWRYVRAAHPSAFLIK